MTGQPKGPLTVNGKILQDLIRARVSLQRVEARVFARDILPVLQRMEAQILGHIAAIQAGTRTLNDVSLARIQSLLDDVQRIIANAVAQAQAGVAAAAADVAGRENRLQVATMKRATKGVGVTFGSLPTDTLAQVTQAVTDDIAGPWFSKWGTDALGKVQAALSTAIGMGEDKDETARRVAQAMNMSKKKALTVARTGLQKAANDTAAGFHQDNQAAFNGVIYVATLDARTCPVCGPFDGKRYSFESHPDADGSYDNRPEVPQHPDCRCFYSPWAKSERELGIDLDDPDIPGTRASMDGQVPDTTTWDQWLKSQPVSIQKAALGPKKFAQWKSTGILESFSSSVRRFESIEWGRFQGRTGRFRAHSV